jgi:hypothetical protein
MTTKAIRQELIDWIGGMNDPRVLAAMLDYKRSASEARELSPEQLASIDRGLEDMNAGRVRPSSEVWKKYGI